MERKYWLQFAKLQNTNMIRVYDKEVEPKAIFLSFWEHAVQLVSCYYGPKMETPLSCTYCWTYMLR